MSVTVAYLIVAMMVMIGAKIGGKEIRELSILSLGMAMTMEESIVGKIVIISAIIVNIIGERDSETIMLYKTGVIGLIIVGGATEMMKIYIGIEIVSLSFYVLAARERKGMKGTEGGIKYFIMGALSSGILLMGITIVYAQTGSTEVEMVGTVSRTMIIVGILFKIGAAPFHM